MTVVNTSLVVVGIKFFPRATWNGTIIMVAVIAAAVTIGFYLYAYAAKWRVGLVPRASKEGEILPLHCTSCGSALSRSDVYYDSCGVCGTLPMPLEFQKK